jgi:hypothetical protein
MKDVWIRGKLRILDRGIMWTFLITIGENGVTKYGIMRDVWIGECW